MYVLYVYIYIYIYIYISLARQAAFPPPCVPLSRGESGGAQLTENAFKMLQIKAEFHSSPKMVQNPRQNGPKCIHVGSKNEAWRGTPSACFWVIFKVFEALGGLSRFGRVLRLVLQGSWKKIVSKMAPSCPSKSSQHRLKNLSKNR